MSLTSLCVSLLISSGPALPYAPAGADLTAAQDWLESNGVRSPTYAQLLEALRQWEIWSSAPPSAREAQLGVELKIISPPRLSTLEALHGATESLKL